MAVKVVNWGKLHRKRKGGDPEVLPNLLVLVVFIVVVVFVIWMIGAIVASIGTDMERKDVVVPKTSPLYWDLVERRSKVGHDVFRTPTPEGWLVHLDEHGSLIYVPDKYHLWLDENEEED